MLLRNNLQLALNDVETLLIESADHYGSAAGKASDPELSRLFKELEAERNQLAKELAEHIRALDDLPQTPDPDMESVSDLLTSVKAFFASDERGALIDEREQFEHKIADVVQTALRENLSEDAKVMLGKVLEHTRQAISRLEAMRSSAQP
jgi:uncharacterized protein (TIGR02284 family)